MTAAARVARLLEIARFVVDPDHPLGQRARAELTATGLSPAGVELALARLETTPSEGELGRLLTWAPAVAGSVWVVLAANVCTAALRALACAAAQAQQIYLRPSRRDPFLARIFAEAVDFVALVDDIAPQPGDVVHAYGSDDSLAAIAEGVTVPVMRHGSGFGVAALERPSRTAVSGLADDLVVFDGRGCLSPRVVVTPAVQAGAVAMALHRELLERSTPRGPLSQQDRSALALARRTFASVGVVYEGTDHIVAVDDDCAQLVLLPPLRATVVCGLRSTAVLEPWRRYVTSVGGQGELADAVAALCPQARRARLGAMQAPPLDGPVDRRTTWSS